jgi:hypothetical protein
MSLAMIMVCSLGSHTGEPGPSFELLRCCRRQLINPQLAAVLQAELHGGFDDETY